MITCREAQNLFDAYLDGRLSGALRTEVDAHRLSCRSCGEALTLLEACGSVIATDTNEPKLPDDFADRVLADMAPVRGRRRFNRWMMVGSSLAAAAAIALVVGFWPRQTVVAAHQEIGLLEAFVNPVMLPARQTINGTRSSTSSIATLTGMTVEEVNKSLINVIAPATFTPPAVEGSSFALDDLLDLLKGGEESDDVELI